MLAPQAVGRFSVEFVVADNRDVVNLADSERGQY